MDINAALNYAFDDEDCVPKVGLGGLLMFIPIANFACVGYEARTIRNLVRGDPQPLPTWSDFSTLLMDGLWLGLARLLYSLPALALLMCAVGGGVTYFYMAGSESEMQERLPSVLLLCGGAFTIFVICMAIIGFFSPAVTIQYIRRGTFGACFNFGAILQLIRRNFTDYLTLWAVTIGVSLVVNLIVSVVSLFINIIPCVGTFIQFLLMGASTFWILLMAGHLQAQLIRADEARGAIP